MRNSSEHEAKVLLRLAEQDLEVAFKCMEAAFSAHLTAFSEYQTEYGELPPIYIDPENPRTIRISAALRALRQAEKERDDARRRIEDAKRVLLNPVPE